MFPCDRQIASLTISLGKTGTTRLAALQILEFNAQDNMAVVKYARGQRRADFTPQPVAFIASTSTPRQGFCLPLPRNRHRSVAFAGMTASCGASHGICKLAATLVGTGRLHAFPSRKAG